MLEEAGNIPAKLKIAVLPLKVAEVMDTPLAYKTRFVIFAGFPEPDTARTSWVRVMVELLGFVNRICCTGILESPASWFEFPGGLEPWEAVTVTAVGVEVG